MKASMPSMSHVKMESAECADLPLVVNLSLLLQFTFLNQPHHRSFFQTLTGFCQIFHRPTMPSNHSANPWKLSITSIQSPPIDQSSAFLNAFFLQQNFFFKFRGKVINRKFSKNFHAQSVLTYVKSSNPDKEFQLVFLLFC
jgi:hypothetical protein